MREIFVLRLAKFSGIAITNIASFLERLRVLLGSLRRLFARYCDHHFAITLKGFALFGPRGEKIGHVDRLCFGLNSVRVEGWSIADQVAFGAPSKAQWQRPNVRRLDANRAVKRGDNEYLGFNRVWFDKNDPLYISLKVGNATTHINCEKPGRWTVLKAKIHIRISFAKSALSAPLVFARALLKPNQINRLLVKRTLSLEPQNTSQDINPDFLQKPKPAPKPRCVTLVMPVFNAFEVLREALARIDENTDVKWRLILVEDCSTDHRILPMLRDWASQQRRKDRSIILLENSQNLGFIKSVNRAFAHALKFPDHVVLLNSDALVPDRWATRLLYPIFKNANVASVTPLSNDAEIFCAPHICKKEDLNAGVADEIDLVLSKEIANTVFQPAPTAVGFCMAINRKFLTKLPEFDTGFGKGYGEEVDWCQKIQSLGGEHVVQPNVFVEHRGGASFGDAAKQEAIVQNNKIISKRYPRYDRHVQDFIAHDPIITARLIVALAKIGNLAVQAHVYIAHSLGGGAELYLRGKIEDGLKTGVSSVVLRVGGRSSWRIEVHTPEGITSAETEKDWVVHKLVGILKNRRLIYSCAVGCKDPVGLPEFIQTLLKQSETHFTFLVHDYFAICPSYCLLNSEGRFIGVPDVQHPDPAYIFKDAMGRATSHLRWRQEWSKLVNAADQIECFSQSSASIMKDAFKELKTPILVKEHEVRDLAPLAHRGDPSHLTIGILGDIGVQKGAACVQKISNFLDQQGIGKMVVVGRVDPMFELASSTILTGAYERTQIVEIAEKHNISVWIIPSIWPETFSYTTHEALATGLPVFAFDLGAQGDAVKAAKNGHSMPLHWEKFPVEIVSYIRKVLNHGSFGRRPPREIEKPRDRGIAA